MSKVNGSLSLPWSICTFQYLLYNVQNNPFIHQANMRMRAYIYIYIYNYDKIGGTTRLYLIKISVYKIFVYGCKVRLLFDCVGKHTTVCVCAYKIF